MPLPAISLHAYERARERLNWGGRTLERMLARVHHLGLSARRCRAGLRRFLESKAGEGGLPQGSGYALIHGEVLYIFSRGPRDVCSTLVTLYQLPPEMRIRLRAHRQREQRWRRGVPLQRLRASPGHGGPVARADGVSGRVPQARTDFVRAGVV